MEHPKTMQVIYRSAPDNGPVLINASEFNESKHMKPGEQPAEKPRKRGRPAKADRTEIYDNGNG